MKNGIIHTALLCLLICVVLGAAGADSVLAAGTKGATTAGEDSVLTVWVVGDLLLDRGVRAEIGRSGAHRLFDGVRPLFRTADAVIANLECPVTEQHAPLEKKYVFRAEPRWLTALRAAGITHVTLANNHSNDQGREGLTHTLKALAGNGIGAMGGGSQQEAACAPVLLEKNGIRLAVFAANFVPLENWMYDADRPGPCEPTSDDLVRNIRSFLASSPGAHCIAVVHWGWEFRAEPNEEQSALAQALLDAGAEAVIGHHPHVIQTVERSGEKTVVYSVGNFVFDQRTEEARRALAVKLLVTGRGIDVRLVPLRISACAPAPMPRRDAAALLRAVAARSHGVAFTRSGGEWRVTTTSNSRAGTEQ